MQLSKKKRRLISFAFLVTIFVAVPIVVLDLSATAAHHMITNPIEGRVSPLRTPAEYDIEYETLELQTEDGLRLAAWYIPSKNGAVVIAVHGYKSNRESMLGETDMLVRHGFGVLLFDSRAHGDSDGETIRFGAVEMYDFEAAYQYLLTRPDVDPNRIGLIGSSNGGAMSILYAAQNPGIKALVTDSAYAALEDEIAIGVAVYTILPAFPFAPFVQYFAEREAGFSAKDISPVAVISQISPNATLIVQGGKDDTIPVESGQQLYDAAGMPKKLWFVPSANHTSIDADYPLEYENRIISFFNRYLLEIVEENK